MNYQIQGLSIHAGLMRGIEITPKRKPRSVAVIFLYMRTGMLSLLHLHRRGSPVPFKALASCLSSNVPDSRLVRAP